MVPQLKEVIFQIIALSYLCNSLYISIPDIELGKTN